VEGAEHRRVRRHRAEQVGLQAQVLDVRAALAASGEHQGGVHRHLPAIVDGETFASHRDPARERIAQAQTIGKAAKVVQSDMGHHARPAGFNNHVGRAATVHLGSALLLLGSCCVENNSFPCAEGFSADAGRSDQAAS